MKFQLTVTPENSYAEGMYRKIESDVLPRVNEDVKLELGDNSIYGKVFQILHILNAEDSGEDVKFRAVIVYVSVSMTDYRSLETSLPSSWSNFDHI